MSAGARLTPNVLSFSSPHPNFRFIFPTTRLGAESQFSDFLDGLGPAQIVGRQTLATPPMGESPCHERVGAPPGPGRKGRRFSVPSLYLALFGVVAL